MPYDDGKKRPRVLDGIRVVDFTQLIAGPCCTRIMADMGAEVIKIERLPGGDATRQLPAIREGVSGLFLQYNVGKKGLCLDLRQTKALEIVKELVRRCDVVVENFKVGAMARMGLGYETLRDLNPGLIMCSISGYGQTGPYKDRLGLAAVVHAATGVTETLRRGHGEDLSPAAHGLSLSDTIAGYHAANAVTAALFYRERTGTGQYIDINLYDSLFFSIDYQVEHYLMTGEEPPARWGVVPFEGKDGYLTIGLGKHELVFRLIDCMGKPEVRNDVRFSTMENIIVNNEALRAIVEDWLKSFDSIEEAEKILVEAGLPVSKVCSVKEAIHSQQVESRGLLVDIHHPKLGKTKVMNTPFKFSETESTLQGSAPDLGEHNQEILSAVINYSREEIEKLSAEGVLFSKS